MLMNRTENLPDILLNEMPQWHPPHTAARILVVDDDDDIRQLNATVLKGSGYEVDTAVDGDAAWAILDTQCYDLLITDHSMPKLTGIELLNELHVAGKSLPSILVSGDLPTQELHRHPWLRISATLSSLTPRPNCWARSDRCCRWPRKTANRRLLLAPRNRRANPLLPPCGFEEHCRTGMG
jgi:CheY-like chemotaxis protein